MTNDQIKHMAERFLTWRLPENFHPDGGITATRPNYAPNVPWQLTGTNLFDYEQAKAMVLYMVNGADLERKSQRLDDCVTCGKPKVSHYANNMCVVYPTYRSVREVLASADTHPKGGNNEDWSRS